MKYREYHKSERETESYDCWHEGESYEFLKIETIVTSLSEYTISEDELQRHKWREYRVKPKFYRPYHQHKYKSQDKETKYEEHDRSKYHLMKNIDRGFHVVSPAIELFYFINFKY